MFRSTYLSPPLPHPTQPWRNSSLVVRVQYWSREPEIAELLTRVGARCVVDHLDLDRTWDELEFEHPSHEPAPANSGRAAA